MQKSIMLLIALALLGGCSRHYHPLATDKKVRLVTELVSDAPQCSTFKTRLASPAMDDDGVDAVYHEATRAGCIKKDV